MGSHVVLHEFLLTFMLVPLKSYGIYKSQYKLPVAAISARSLRFRVQTVITFSNYIVADHRQLAKRQVFQQPVTCTHINDAHNQPMYPNQNSCGQTTQWVQPMDVSKPMAGH